MNILFTICGRKGSKGIKNKNIQDFLNYPLPYYSLSAIDLFKKENMSYTIDVVVNSDSRELLSMMRKSPFFKMEEIIRDSELGGELVPKPVVVLDCMNKMQDRKKTVYDVVVDLDITSPLRTVFDIQNLINTHAKTGADVTTSVTGSRRNPYFNMVKRTEKGFKKVLDSDFTARQQAPEIFDMNASLYAYNPKFLKTGKGVLEGYCECIYMYDTGILDLDHENDFELMQVIADYLFHKKDGFREIYENIRSLL